MTPSISISHLSKTFPGGVTALVDLSLDVPAGSVFGFLGPNGAGKTTTLKILAGLARPTAGRVVVAGLPLDAGVSYRRRIGFLAQEPMFYGWMTGRETLRYVAGFYPSIPNPERRVDEMVELAGLGAAADRRTAEYSSGMRQRLGIAQALVASPPVLLLDEPMSALDPIGRREVLALLHRLRGATTVVYSTHILDDVERVADHVAILDHGRLVAAAPTAELLGGAGGGTLRVVAIGAGLDLDARLLAIDGVVTVDEEGGPPPGNEAHAHALRRLVVRTAPASVPDVQVAITRVAAEAGLALIENRPITHDLETAFVRLVGDRERVA